MDSWKLGGLGPDKESDEYLSKMEKRLRQKEYSQRVRSLAMNARPGGSTSGGQGAKVPSRAGSPFPSTPLNEMALDSESKLVSQNQHRGASASAAHDQSASERRLQQAMPVSTVHHQGNYAAQPSGTDRRGSATFSPSSATTGTASATPALTVRPDDHHKTQSSTKTRLPLIVTRNAVAEQLAEAAAKREKMKSYAANIRKPGSTSASASASATALTAALASDTSVQPSTGSATAVDAGDTAGRVTVAASRSSSKTASASLSGSLTRFPPIPSGKRRLHSSAPGSTSTGSSAEIKRLEEEHLRDMATAESIRRDLRL
ncbi:hypothetical protein BC831DRAFT_473045 [Entophlyctis helioformis]|nr:hypothetical protein BC831DRAFT_473045 [Entophlyctis helioformis]